MDKEKLEQELNSEEYNTEWEKHENINKSMITCLSIIFMNFGRDRDNHQKNFFIRVVDDIMHSSVAIKMLASEGMRNTCRRELRFLIELSIKACFVSQQFSKSTFEEQINEYEKQLKSTNISLINDINFYLLGSLDNQSTFKQDTKRMYGEMCSYVHLTPHQITERLYLAQEGRYMGFEGVNELKQLNEEVSKVYSYVIVHLFHSIPVWVVGDLLVNGDGSSYDWYFNKSRYIAEIDSRFDYKAERKQDLEEIRINRSHRIEF
ncbi:hypothetical protein [Paenibacillus chitinolyticus]|uniref:hypothetical protein n=1 Tax=Paenibacillus chitinolyticus TaxID=79263 RepID=UPI003CFFDD47